MVLATTAQAGVERDYTGRAEKDPNTFIGFDLAKKHGKTRVAHFLATLPYTCAGESGGGGSAAATAKGSLVVKDDRTFSGKLKTGNFQTRGNVQRGLGPTRGDYRIEGKLGKHGKAAGTIAGELFFNQTMRGGQQQQVRCYTGGLDWKAKKTG